MMHLLYSMYLLCTSRRPFQQVLCYTSHTHTKNPNAQNHDSRPDTKVTVSAALYFMLHHRFAMQLSAAADSQPAELQLLDCNCALYDDIGHQAGVCQLSTCDRRCFMVLKPELNSSSLVGVAISSNHWLHQSHL